MNAHTLNLNTPHMNTDMVPVARRPLLTLAFWLYVSIPLSWGVWSTMQKAMALFQ